MNLNNKNYQHLIIQSTHCFYIFHVNFQFSNSYIIFNGLFYLNIFTYNKYEYSNVRPLRNHIRDLRPNRNDIFFMIHLII